MVAQIFLILVFTTESFMEGMTPLVHKSKGNYVPAIMVLWSASSI